VTRARRGAWLALGVLAVVNLLNYAHRNVLQPCYDDLRGQFGFSNGELGFLGAAYMFVHALATVPMGWAGDRYDRRRLIAFGLGLASIAAGAAALASGLASLTVSRALTGLGTAAIVPTANSILGEAFEGDGKALAMAVFNLGLFLGGVFGFGLGGAFGFPTSFLVFAAPGLILVPLVARLPVPPRRAGAGDPARATGLRQFVRDARELLRGRTFRWLMGSATAMAFAAGGYLAWLLDFLGKERHLGEAGAVRVLGIALFGGLAGVITGGRLADRLRRRWPAGRMIAIVIGMAATVPCALACLYGPGGAFLYAGSVLMMFFVSWYHGPIAASVDDLAPPERAATAQSLVIFVMHAAGTAPAWWIIGAVSDATSLTTAMLVPTTMVAVAALLMARAAATYPARGGSVPPAAL
jgi:MFS transporter, Spinster family, sphingosine-1-phosphate transporter